MWHCNEFTDLSQLYEYKMDNLHIFISANQEELMNLKYNIKEFEGGNVTNQNVDNVKTNLLALFFSYEY